MKKRTEKKGGKKPKVKIPIINWIIYVISFLFLLFGYWVIAAFGVLAYIPVDIPPSYVFLLMLSPVILFSVLAGLYILMKGYHHVLRARDYAKIIFMLIVITVMPFTTILFILPFIGAIFLFLISKQHPKTLRNDYRTVLIASLIFIVFIIFAAIPDPENPSRYGSAQGWLTLNILIASITFFLISINTERTEKMTVDKNDIKRAWK